MIVGSYFIDFIQLFERRPNIYFGFILNLTTERIHLRRYRYGAGYVP